MTPVVTLVVTDAQSQVVGTVLFSGGSWKACTCASSPFHLGLYTGILSLLSSRSSRLNLCFSLSMLGKRYAVLTVDGSSASHVGADLDLMWSFSSANLLSGDCVTDVSPSTLSVWSWPKIKFHVVDVDLVIGGCGVSLLSRRPELESRDPFSIFIPEVFCLGSHPLCPDEDYGPSPICLISHPKPSLSGRASFTSFDDWGIPPRRRPAAIHTDYCSSSLSLLSFIDLRLNSVLGKLSWLQYGNVEAESSCLSSVIAFMESIVKLNPLSASVKPQMVGSEGYTFLLGAIFGVFPKCSSIAHHQSSTPTRANTKGFLFLSWSLSKLEDCSPLALFLIKASQNSSCRGHERPLSTILRFVGVITSIKTPLCEKDSVFGYVVNELCRYPDRLMPYVMVRLGPEGTTILIPMRIEVTEHLTSRYTVTISVEELEGRRNLFRSLLVCGTFELSFDLLSGLSKLVSLSLYCLILNVFSRIAHLLLDVAFIFVIGGSL
ncbi:hypothetical protein Bca4012_031687 [Brassica carinata]|uniref:Uncharacterized protein n=1 Tax=Brassica carinata TaxID=52824 RepID=A0A8X7RCW6_BRACI|nr:hypothetical protein Bca52824_046532 [Brassica carinata]